MASHVVVIDSALRRHTVKTTPGKYLSDVLREACDKFGLPADQFGLKHNNKPVDLSRTIRLSGLSSGAKLELTQASRSPTVVSIALQVPIPGGSTRLTNKFPSNTSVWQILRRFESGVAGVSQAQGVKHNFTQRAVPVMQNSQGAGSGRMCYEMPVVNIMGRELSTFPDLQKTMAQLGYNGGNVLLRLNFKATDQPLEEAMNAISQYFKEVEVEESKPKGAATTSSADVEASRASTSEPAPEPAAANPDKPADIGRPDYEAENTKEQSTHADAEELPDAPPASNGENTEDALADQESSTPAITFYAPPTTNTPMAASFADQEEDYTPSVAHAEAHQARLARESRNKKLLSEQEIAAEAQERDAKLASIATVAVRMRFPDQSQALREFSQRDTVHSLYETCREIMDRPRGEEFFCRVAGNKGSLVTLTDTPVQSQKRLIRDLGWKGRVLVTVVWGDNVGAETRRRPVLKEQYRKQAEKLKVELQQGAAEDGESENRGQASVGRATSGGAQDKGKGKANDVESKMKKFLGFGKKK